MYAYPAIDSVVWRSASRAPALERTIAFGAEDGYLAVADANGAPVRLDLRLGTVSPAIRDPLRTVSSADGSAIYALTRSGDLTRFTPSGGDWRFHPPLPVSALFAQTDGSLIVAGVQGKRVIVWRVRPPGQTVSDSISFDVGGTALELDRTIAATAGTIGDRIYFGANESVIVVRTRDLTEALKVSLGDPVRAIVNTPSGDRMFVALDGQEAIRVVDRFEEGVTGKIKLPSVPQALRMDALGRVLLARGEADTVFVISLGDDKLAGVVKSAWRADLPVVLADGSIASARGANVVFAVAGSLANGRIVAGGASDFWQPLRWNGFRPRAAGLDQPVRFRSSASRVSEAVVDSAASTDSGAGVLSTAAPVTNAAAPAPSAARADSTLSTVYSVSFTALSDERQARVLASKIHIPGQTPRITTLESNGRTLYRVVLGPFRSHDEAERVGKASAQSYWIFRGAP